MSKSLSSPVKLRSVRFIICLAVLLSLGLTLGACGTKKKSKEIILPPGGGGGTGPGGTGPGGFKAVVAAFTGNPTHGTGSLNVQFTDQSAGLVTSWAWDFDYDGVVDSTSQHPLHTYGSVGWYSVSLTVAGPDGSDTATKVTYIHVANGISTVDVNGNGDFTTLQAAIDAAGDYDLILVKDGTYMGVGNKDLHFDGKKICLKSENGPDKCIIDCEGDGRAFNFQLTGETLDSVIDGFTIQNAYSGSGEGAAIYLYASDATISNCILKNNKTNGGGGAICNRDSESFISNTIIENNQAGFSGGAIYMRTSSRATLIDCVLRNNVSGGSGGAIGADATLKIYRSVFEGNTANGRGGAIAQWHSGGGTLIDCWIKNNSAGSDGGGLAFDHTSMGTNDVIERCFITGNTAGEEGGGIFFRDQARPLVVNTVIANNSAGTIGGGICAEFFCRLESVVNCVIAYNSAGTDGGGFYFNDQRDDSFSVNIDNTIIWANTATGEGNQIYVNDTGRTLLNYSVYSNDAGDIAGPGSIVDTECIYGNPMFANGANNDFHLQIFSPCLEKGSNSLVPSGIETDLDGDDRITGTVEIGAYEH
ncbi:MAG: PKD domain-containing protein [Planctomycetota bacterium]|nr:MAG: PKD domain-containing protein [Planctomycetota bacterium]